MQETFANHANERESYLTIQCGVFDRSFIGVDSCDSRASELRGPAFFCVAAGGAIASRVVCDDNPRALAYDFGNSRSGL